MNFDDSFPKRVSIARSALGLTQSELAKLVGVVPRQIAAYEGAEARPREKALQNLAAALGTTMDWLTNGKGDGPNINNVRRTVTRREIPVLTHVQARFESFEELLSSAAIKDFIPAPEGANEDCFAVQIQGDSMSSAEGISFPHGSIVTFNSAIKAMPGDYVMCVLDDFNEAAFKQLVVDQGQPYLKSLNPLFPLINPDFMEIVGVAIHVQMSLYRDNRDLPCIPNEIDRLIAERSKVNKEFWDNPDLTANAHFDSRLKKLEEIAEKLDSIFSSQVVQQVVQKADYPSPSSMVEDKGKKK